MASAAQPAPDLSSLLGTSIDWTANDDDLDFPWRASLNGRTLTLRMNDFPDETLYSLLIDGQVVGSFDDWPSAWTRATN